MAAMRRASIGGEDEVPYAKAMISVVTPQYRFAVSNRVCGLLSGSLLRAWNDQLSL